MSRRPAAKHKRKVFPMTQKIGQIGPVGSVAGSAVEMTRLNETHYAMAQDGRTLAREEKLNWFWVLRDTHGEHIDHDRYRADLAERNGLRLLEPNIEITNEPPSAV
jgi:hypothetical protein